MTGSKATLVCTFCKKRKIKCDRKKPCSSCKRYGKKCRYPEDASQEQVQLIRRLNRKIEAIQRGIKPGNSVNSGYVKLPKPVFREDNDMYTGVMDMTDNVPHLNKIIIASWPAAPYFLSNDPPESESEEEEEEEEEEEDFESDGEDIIASFDQLYDTIDSNEQFCGPLAMTALYKCDNELNGVFEKISKFEEFKLIYDNPSSKEFNISFNLFNLRSDNTIESYQPLVNRIENALPPSSIIDSLIDDYFRKEYLFAPLIDERYFRTNNANILHYQADGSVIVKLSKVTDLYHVGVLMILLKLTHLSENVTYRSVTVNEGLVDLSVEIINCFNIITNTDLDYFQLLVLFRFYESSAPEYGDSLNSNISSTLSAIILQKAYDMNLHQEPTHIQTGDDGRFNNLRRKFWFLSFMLDALYSFLSGNPSNYLKVYTFDCRSPYFNGKNANNSNAEIENLCILLSKRTKIFDSNSWSTHTMGNAFKVGKLQKSMERHFDVFNDLRETYSDLANIETELKNFYFKNYKLKFYFQTSVMLLTVYDYIFQIYHKRGKFDKALDILKLLFKNIYQQLLPISGQIFHGFRHEQSLNSFLLVPSLQTLLNTIVIINLSLLTKVSGELRDLVKKGVDIFMNYLQNLSSRYYYSWRAFKIHEIALANLGETGSNPIYSRDEELCRTVRDALTDLEFASFINSFTTTNDDTIWLQVLALKRVTNKS